MQYYRPGTLNLGFLRALYMHMHCIMCVHCTCTYVHTDAYSTCIYMYVHVHVQVHKYVYIYIHVVHCMYMYMYIMSDWSDEIETQQIKNLSFKNSLDNTRLMTHNRSAICLYIQCMYMYITHVIYPPSLTLKNQSFALLSTKS